MTAWTDFLKANAGKGYTRDQLKEMYAKNAAPAKKKPTKKAAPSKAAVAAKAKPKAKTVAKSAKPKAAKAKTVKAKAKAKVQTKLQVVKASPKISAPSSRVKETEYTISIGDHVVVYKPYKSKSLTRPAGITWVGTDNLRHSIKETKQFIADLNDAVDLVTIFNTVPK